MKLRKLEQRDAPLMLEWMHDRSVVGHLATDFTTKTLDNCRDFIAHSSDSHSDLHLAIADDRDEYMGTVSLKHIHQGLAEFAITVRACAMGKGYAAFGMDAILHRGIETLGLQAIYWCVDRANARAVRFYDKSGYRRTESVPASILDAYAPSQRQNYIWYIFP